MNDFSNGLMGGAAQPARNGLWFQTNTGENIRFSEPMSFPLPTSNGFLLPPFPGPGLYAILVRDESIGPRPFRAIYIGESEGIDEAARQSHERFPNWSATAGGAANLFVAYRWMFFSTLEERMALQEALVEHCRPECNLGTDAPTHWAGLRRCE